MNADGFGKLVAALIESGEATDADDITKLVLASPELPRLVEGLVRWRVGRYLSAQTKVSENRSIALGGAGSVAGRAALVDQSFPLPDGRWVEWLRATAADHRARADWLRDHAARTAERAERHEHAAALIEKAGVTCLDELDEEAAA